MKLLRDTFRRRSARWLQVVAGSAVLVLVSLGGTPAAAQPGAEAGKPAAMLAPFDVQMRNQNTDNMCLGIRGSAHNHGAPAIQWDCISNELDQRWDFHSIGTGRYEIRNLNTANMCLGIAGGSRVHGAAAIQWECNSAIADQEWEIDPIGTGVRIINVNSRMCLGIRGSDHRHGAAAIQWDCIANEFDQRWTVR